MEACFSHKENASDRNRELAPILIYPPMAEKIGNTLACSFTVCGHKRLVGYSIINHRLSSLTR